jgi:hypothetical protein
MATRRNFIGLWLTAGFLTLWTTLDAASINLMNEWIDIDDNSNFETLRPISNSWEDSTAEIFVGIVHYRDRRCSATLENLFSKATYPDRLHVGSLGFQKVDSELSFLIWCYFFEYIK